jgi:hypothetical protein
MEVPYVSPMWELKKPICDSPHSFFYSCIFFLYLVIMEASVIRRCICQPIHTLSDCHQQAPANHRGHWLTPLTFWGCFCSIIQCLLMCVLLLAKVEKFSETVTASWSYLRCHFFSLSNILKAF